MIKDMPRLGLLTLIAAFAIFLALEFLPGRRELNDQYTNCATQMTSTCLADIGVAEASRAKSLPSYLNEIRALGQMEYIDQAFALELRIQQGKESSPEAAIAAANRHVASHRMTAAIMGGQSPRDAFAQTAGADPGSIFISALDLWGDQPYGPRNVVRRLPDDKTRAIISEMAAMIAEKVSGSGPQSATYRAYAAELFALVGQRDDAVDVLRPLATDENWHERLNDEVFVLIGPEIAAELCGEKVDCQKEMQLRAAEVSGDVAVARTYLSDLFSKAARKEPWPDFTEMGEIIERTAERGDTEQALDFARELAALAQQKRGIFPAFPHIEAAKALALAGADTAEIRHSLDLAEADFPRKENEVVGIGMVSGPIQWGGFGLGAQASREIANLRARLGDIDAAVRLMQGIEQPDYAWSEVLTPDVPVDHLDQLLSAAKSALTEEDFAYVRACHAQELVLFDASQAHLAWSVATSEVILQEGLYGGHKAGWIYRCIATVGFDLKNSSIQRAAIESMGRSALESKDYSSLFRAALVLYDFENSERG
ncbi:hypothetical protein [Neogemmobacter tilapiae]|uniref:Uncharacterized protein n=1 Tax=Neogemmobacter tilapiae TaxID=875041 RepID=A0A918TPE8_9RHOB|nr:hypothetical protein [Gemmobacter tilapiae]GHC57434.1 hypothetical protein GCM10007315_21070 [Gemmobacter tilapiae]